jgi:hypothetical protein
MYDLTLGWKVMAKGNTNVLTQRKHAAKQNAMYVNGYKTCSNIDCEN